jgi:hypothetical protein
MRLCPSRNSRRKNEVYPAAVLELFGNLGIAANREADVSHFARLARGRHFYAGWFHFVGTILEGRDAAVQIAENTWQPDLEPVTDRFKLGFTSRVALVAKAFEGLQVVQLNSVRNCLGCSIQELNRNNETHSSYSQLGVDSLDGGFRFGRRIPNHQPGLVQEPPSPGIQIARTRVAERAVV